MLEYIEKTSKIYDLFALCCSFILKEDEKNPTELSNYDIEQYDEVHDAIECYFFDCEEIGQREAFIKLREYIIDFMKPEADIEKCLAVVCNIDDMIDAEFYGKLMGGNHIIKYTALNEQYVDCVKIIPCMKETFLDKSNKKLGNGRYSFFRNRRDKDWSSLDKMINNYMIWGEDYIKTYPLTVYHFDCMNAITEHFKDRDKIVFGIVPFSNEEMKKLLRIKLQNHVFVVEGLKEDIEKKLKDKYEDVYKKAEKEEIDFLIFPEMLMTDEIMGFFSKNQHKKGSPWIIVNGSIWKDLMNKCIITDGYGNEIFSYLKKEPFIYKNKEDGKEYKEWLDRKKNTEYSILDIEGVGRIGIAICKDLLNEKVKLFHKYMGTDFLIVPAYTDSMDLQSSAQELSKEYNCVVIVANACSAVEKPESNRIGFLTLPAKAGSYREEIILRYCRDQCKNDCKDRCVGKKFIINFYDSHTYDSGKISYDVVESSF